MQKKRALAPRAHAPSGASALLRQSVQRATTVLRVPRRVAAPPTAIVQPVPHARTVSAPLPASVPRALTTTVPHQRTARHVGSALIANAPLMATALPGVNASTVSAPPGLSQIGHVRTAPVRTVSHPSVRALNAPVLTALDVTSVPLVSDPVVRHARLMTAPATVSVRRAQ